MSKPRPDSRYPKAAQAMRFDGERYAYRRTWRLKTDAQRHARNLRIKGLRARVTRTRYGHTVWERKA